jgi:dynactin 1
MFAASIGLTKTSITAILQDDGMLFPLHTGMSAYCMKRYAEVILDMGGYDIESAMFQPLQALLDQCKGAKALSKYVLMTLPEFTSYKLDTGSSQRDLMNSWRTEQY